MLFAKPAAVSAVETASATHLQACPQYRRLLNGNHKGSAGEGKVLHNILSLDGQSEGKGGETLFRDSEKGQGGPRQMKQQEPESQANERSNQQADANGNLPAT